MREFQFNREAILKRFKDCAIAYWKEYGIRDDEDTVRVKDGDRYTYIAEYDYALLKYLEDYLKKAEKVVK